MTDTNIALSSLDPIVMPAVSSKDAVSAWKQYQELKAAIAEDSDKQEIQKKIFLKKSYWRKIATFFNLTVDVVSESHEQIGKTMVWHFTCKAIAPNGRSAIGVGSCDAFEKAIKTDDGYMTEKVLSWKRLSNGKNIPDEKQLVPAQPNSLHNIRSTAETRAFNRAVSNLVGGGEVSADEIVVVDQGDHQKGGTHA